MRVFITPLALNDLQATGDYIAEDSPIQAQRYVSRLRERCQSLSEAPLRYPLLPNWELRGLRQAPIASHVIVYRVVSNTVEILRILHAAIDIEAALKVFRDD